MITRIPLRSERCGKIAHSYGLRHTKNEPTCLAVSRVSAALRHYLNKLIVDCLTTSAFREYDRG
jgi:hypothetical protein